MANEGLREYLDLIELEIVDFAIGYANIAQTKYNYHCVIPIYESSYVSPLKLNLIYSFNDRTINNGYGNGYNISYAYYIDASESNTTLIMYYPDGSNEAFVYDNIEHVYYNQFHDKYIDKESGQYPYYLKYLLYKKDGSVLTFFN